jgi:hypothetical protein
MYGKAVNSKIYNKICTELCTRHILFVCYNGKGSGIIIWEMHQSRKLHWGGCFLNEIAF